MKSGYVTRSIVRFGYVQVLSKIWKGVIFSKFSPFRLKEVPDPVVKFPKEVLVENILAGICGTDMSLIQAKVDLRVAPSAISKYDKMYLGHENLARVLDTGEKVTKFKKGDRVTVAKGLDCNLQELDLCESCQNGYPFLCKNNSLATEQLMEIGGGFGELWKYHEDQLIMVPDDISDELAVLTEPMSIGVRAVLRRLPKKGDKVLVWGAGIIGQLTIVALRYLVPDVEVYAIVRYDFQGKIARKYGANVLISPSWENITEITDGKLYRGSLGNKMILGGFDIIYDCVGSSHTVSTSLRWTKAGGAVVLIGINFSMQKIDLNPIWYQEVDLIGSLVSGREYYKEKEMHTFEICFEIMMSGVIDADDFISHKFRLSEYKQAIRTLQNKKKTKGMKVVFDYRD